MTADANTYSTKAVRIMNEYRFSRQENETEISSEFSKWSVLIVSTIAEENRSLLKFSTSRTEDTVRQAVPTCDEKVAMKTRSDCC